MKRILSSVTMLVLTACLFSGCGCRNSRPAETTMPTTYPTVATTAETTEMTTIPSVESTQPTIEDGNGPISTDATLETNDAARAVPGGTGTGTGITGSITGNP